MTSAPSFPPIGELALSSLDVICAHCSIFHNCKTVFDFYKKLPKQEGNMLFVFLVVSLGLFLSLDIKFKQMHSHLFTAKLKS